MIDYYALRAPEYERIYHKPERQSDLAVLRRRVSDFFQGADVLEIACGTGYWTEVIAPSARSILATDSGEEVLEIARGKSYPPARVRFATADAFDLAGVTGRFDAAFAGFWWSHVRREDLPNFLDGFHARLAPGSRVMFLDNRYVEGSSTPIARIDEEGNTYQSRRLSDGSGHEVLKNFPTPHEVADRISGMAEDVETRELEYYWYVSYRTC
jgi:SAM-dependent methyltransferase